jgi:hypothetical protein
MNASRPKVLFGMLAALASMSDLDAVALESRRALRRSIDRRAWDHDRSPPVEEKHTRETCTDTACKFHGPMLRKLQRRAARNAT